MKRTAFLFILLSTLAFAFNVDAKEKIMLFAAASTTDAMNEVIDLYSQTHKDVDIKASYTGSGSLARQIEQGAPADIFISAATEWMSFLKDKKMLHADSQSKLLQSKLVLIGSEAIDNVTMKNFAEYVSANKVKVAVGDPKTVPAGAYAQEVFENLKISDQIKKKLIYSNSVRTALNYVKMREVEFAFVYLSDTVGVKGGFKLLDTVDEKLHSPIIYEIAIVKYRNNASISEFYSFIKSDAAMQIFKKYGF